jgi:LysM repeat protein
MPRIKLWCRRALNPLTVLVGLLSLLLYPYTAIAANGAQSMVYVVQAGDTLTRIANTYGVTVDQLVNWNDIVNPDLILVGQKLTIYVDQGPELPTVPEANTGALSFSWSLVDWMPDDPNYIATLAIQASGGQPPYTYYHDGIKMAGESFEIAWRRCRPKPGSVGVSDALGTHAQQDYWLPAPYCPVGVAIDTPEEGAGLKHYPRNFNITWHATVDPAPALYGLEIEVWENGGWHPWRSYERFSGDLFFVPDPFPGDLAGRVRMWGIYEGKFEGPKTPWRQFEFRVTY